jgi:tRNA pseudouridine55 synthase
MELHGVLVIDKPAGVTSADVVTDVRWRLRTDRAGHTGTLDPMATGVLAICLGVATKLQGWLTSDDKAYEAELELGATTDTLDATGAVVAEDRAAAAAVTRDQLEAALAAFRGAQEQVPPMHSAIKQNGRRLYHAARNGETVDRAPRSIVVHRLELLDADLPRARLAIECSKGTYVRSLIDDLGRALGCGAHLTGLRRTRSGIFGLERALPPGLVTRAAAAAHVIPCAEALALRTVQVADDLLPAVWNANGPLLHPLCLEVPEGERFQMVDGTGGLIAVVRRDGARLCFDRVFKPLTSA